MIRFSKTKTSLVLSLGAFALTHSLQAAPDFAMTAEANDLLDDYCYSCHEDGTEKGDIRLDNISSLALDARLDDLGSQVIRKMLAYALGRQLEYYDEATVRQLAAKLKPDGYRLRDLVFAITDSYPFTTKRLPEK